MTTFCPFSADKVISLPSCVGSVKSGAVSPIVKSDIALKPFNLFSKSIHQSDG